MAAPRSVAGDVQDIEAITDGLTQTILEDDAVGTNLAVATSARTDDIDTITNGLGQAMLGEGENERLATVPAEEEKAAEKEDQGAKLDEASSADDQIAEQAKGSHTNEAEDAVDALGAACSSWSLETEEEAEARREAQRLRDQIQKKHEDNMKALENAEAKRRADEDFDALERQLKAQIDGARLRKMKRKARKEKDQEAARQLRVAAEAEAVVIAERRARQERQAHDEALELQAKREADNKARLELSEAYGRILHNGTIAEANARQAELQQQQREAELIAQYHEVVARQAHFAEQQQRQQRQQEELILQQHAELAELERQRQEVLFFQQHHSHPPNGQVSESVEEMDTAPEAGVCEVTEMDTAPEMEAFGGTEMEWEIEKEKSRLPAELLPPSSPPAPEPSAPVQGLPSPDEPLTTVKETGNKAKCENFSPHSFSQSAIMASTVAMATPELAASAPLHLPPLREALKARRIDTRSQAPEAAQAATPQPSLAPAPPLAAEPPVKPPPAPPTPPTPATPADPAAPPAPPALVAAVSPPPQVPAPPLAPPAPPAARPAPSIPALTIVFQKRAVRNPTLVPKVNAWSPLGRLLSQHEAIPKVTLTQVLGKRAREDGVEGGRVKKMAKFEGEFRLQVGGKRKREEEEYPGKKRVTLSRRLAVPCSRFAASRSADSAVPEPTFAPNSTPPSHPLTPAPSTPFAPPPPVLEHIQVNPHGGLAEAIGFYSDLPTLRREIAWMRAQRQVATTRKEIRGKKTSIGKKATERTATQASYWSKYRENLSR